MAGSEKVINLERAYIVCQFQEDNDTESIAVIPNSWLITQKSCVFPLYSSQFQVNKAIISKETPSSDWKVWRLKVLSAHGKLIHLFTCYLFH